MSKKAAHDVWAAGAVAITVMVLCATGPAQAALGDGECVSFESLGPGSIGPGGTAVDSGVTMTGVVFVDSDGDPVFSGGAQRGTTQRSGGTGQDMELTTFALDFDFGGPVDDLGFLYREYSGTINIKINGEFRNLTDLEELDGQTVGSTEVEVVAGPTGYGYVRIDGTVTDFLLGGTDLAIDEVCEAGAVGTCLDFNDLTAGTNYPFGRFLVDNSVPTLVDEFTLSGGGTTEGNGVTVDDSVQAGGTGFDLAMDESTVRPYFGGWFNTTSLRYGIYSGNMNLEVNGILANINHPSEIANTMVGGATVTITQVNANIGTVTLTGPVSSIAVGGQDFWIDDLCVANPLDVELFEDGFESGDTTGWSSTVEGD